MPKVQVVKASTECREQKLISFLRQKTGLPYSRLMKLIRTGQVRINGKRTFPFYRLQQDDEIRIPPYSNQPQTKPDFKLNIIYEDEQIIIINKNPGIAVNKGSHTLFSVMDVVKQQYNNLPYLPTPVHRLDKDTSGLLILAKTFQTLRKLQINWSKVEKKYLAVVEGNWPERKPIILTHYLYKTKNGQIVNDRQKGKKSVCQVKLLTRSKQYSLLEISLMTGRTRQIRAQLSLLGYPILGDKKFNPSNQLSPLHLHAYYLSFWGHIFKNLPPWQVYKLF